MKKLLLALLIASAAAVSQAVVLNWTYSDNDAAWIDYISTGAIVYASEGGNVKTAFEALKSTVTNYKVVVAEASHDGDQHNWRPLLSLDAYATLADTDKNTTVGTYYILLFDELGNTAYFAVNAADTANAWLSGVGSNTSGTCTPVELDFEGTLVPEPTALALLALGVAGLALRRKA